MSQRMSLREKERLLQEVWSGKKKIAQVCREARISRPTYYKWEKRALEALRKALKEEPAGRREKEYVPEEKLRKELKNLREGLKKSQKETAKIERQKKLVETDLYMSRKIIEWRIEDGSLDIKKNGDLARLVKKLFSVMPRRLPK